MSILSYLFQYNILVSFHTSISPAFIFIQPLKTGLCLQNITDIQNLLEHPPTLYQVQYHLLDIPSPHRIPIRKHHIRISFVVPPCKYINTQPILLLYLCCSLILICINAFSISIIHAGYNMHILLLPVHHRKDKNLLPAPALDLTVFCIFPDWYLM